MAEFRLTLLGSFALSGVCAATLSKKAQALLAYLAMPPGQTYRRDKLASMLWSDRSEEAARQNLRQCLSTIRRVTETALPIIAEGDLVRLDPTKVTVDVCEFEQALRSRNHIELDRAAALYRGELLEGLNLQGEPFEEWLVGERRRLRASAIEGLSQLLEHQQRSGAREEAMQTALRLLTIDPLQEGVHRSLMRFYHETGNTAQALRQYAICEKALRRELNVEPEAATKELRRDILRSRSVYPRPSSGESDGDSVGNGKSLGRSTAARDARVLTFPVEGVAPSAAPRLSIAVLPFVNLSNDPDQEYLADGLADSLTTDLSYIPGSLVIARSSAFTYKGQVVDAKQVGAELGVRYLLEGSVLRGGDRVRVNAQLIDAQTGMHLWAERYDRNMGDVLAVQDDITCRIALSLDVALHEVESQRALRERPTNPDASDLVMRASAILNRRVTSSDITRALRFFEEALRIDPQSVAALVGVARTNIGKVLSHSSDDRERNIQVAEDAITRALELNPTNALAHYTRGLVFRAQGKLEASLAAFRTAIELNHNEVWAYVAIGDSECVLGRAEEAINALQHALRLDPRPHRISIFAMLGWSHLLLGRDDEAIDWFLRSIHHNPAARRSHLWLACAYALRGEDREALASLRTFNQLMPGFTISKNTAVDASDHPVFVRQRDRLYAALRKIGVPD